MSISIFLFSGSVYIELPNGVEGWLGWFLLAAVTGALAYAWRGYNNEKESKNWKLLAALAILTPLTAVLVLLRLPAGEALPPPGKPVDPLGPALLIFSAIPWMFAAGLMGSWAGALLAAISGLLIALGDTHSMFTPLEYSLLGLTAGALFQQRYRTRFFRLVRQPLPASVLLAAGYPVVYTVNTLFMTSGTLANRLDYALTRTGYASLAVAGELLVAGLFAQVAALMLSHAWGTRHPLEPSPSERRLSSRFLYSMAPLAFVLVTALVLSDWVVAGNAARDMLRGRMGSTAKVAAESVPFFLEAGQNLIQQLARDPQLLKSDPQELRAHLESDMRTVPFFRQLFLLDEKGRPLSGYPVENFTHSQPPMDEATGVALALHGVPIQIYTVPPLEGEIGAQVSFMTAILDESGQTQRVLIGRADLGSNPFTKAILNSLQEIASIDGEGMLLDGEGRVLYHPNPNRLMEVYNGQTGVQALFYDDSAPDGTRRLVYYYPVQGHSWSVVLSIPARRAQQQALGIAAPLLGMIAVLILVTLVFLHLGLRTVTGSLNSLSGQASLIASGQLDQPLPVEGEDEVGQLRRSFEQMRQSLKARMDELNRLLVVSQGVASSLEMEESVQPVLDSALLTGANAARVVLDPSAVPEGDPDFPTRFGLGDLSEAYQYLDHQILALTRQQERVMLNNMGRVRSITIPVGSQRPEAVLALALRHENTYYGALWLAFDRPHPYTDDEIRFLVTLAGQAALAAANASLFQGAEIGRQRLASILASTPDPVLVTDRQNCLLLANPAAWQALNITESALGNLIDEVTHLDDLTRLMRNAAQEKDSAEIAMPDGRIYLATASSVMADGKRVGRVCVMRDITHFKELDSLKSDFVATVSHDLRSPLTLMRGYATMLEMVGELNDQQNGYVKKIVTAVESMSRLVKNLLDLGRIEAGIDLQLETVLIHEVVERVTGSLQLQATQKQIQMSLEIPNTTVPLIEADQALLQQALQNLVENAVKYTDNGGRVRVGVFTRADGMVFEVSDTGIGIAPVDLPRLFEKFYRGVHRESKKQPGTGLGLAIVKSIAERHGGRVWVESQLGQGTTFFMLIPIRQTRREAASALKTAA